MSGAGGGRRDEIRGIRGLVVEADLAPGIDGRAQWRAPPGRIAQNLRTLAQVVTTLVSSLNDGLERNPIGGRAGLNTHRVTDGAAAELQHDVLAQVVDQLVHLSRM